MAANVANGIGPNWPVEDIPDEDRLYMWAHRNYIDPKTGDFGPGMFRIRSGEDGMSTAWSKYSTAEQLHRRAKKPQDNAIIVMRVGEVRAIPNQVVRHKPLPDHQAHSEIEGEKDTEARAKYLEIYQIAIPLLEAAQ